MDDALSANALARAAAAELERERPPTLLDRVRSFSPLAIMVRRPCACLLLWMALPIVAAALVVPDMYLTDPEVGWKIKHGPEAVALDTLSETLDGEGSLGWERSQELVEELLRPALSSVYFHPWRAGDFVICEKPECRESICT